MGFITPREGWGSPQPEQPIAAASRFAGMARVSYYKNTTTKLLTMLLAGLIPLSAQEFTPRSDLKTKVAGHQLGESVQEWLDLCQLNLQTICGNKHKGDPRANYKRVCTTLSAAVAGQDKEFYTTDVISQTFRKIGWFFSDAKVVKVEITIASYQNAGDQITFLANVYGPPTTSETQHYQNSYGAIFSGLNATWALDNGDLILGLEVVRTLTDREFVVTFLSKEAQAKLLQAVQPQANPFK